MQLHIFNNCKLALDSYKWRHNSVISTICNHLKTKLTNGLLQLYADINGYVNPATIFKRRDQAITITPMQSQTWHCAGKLQQVIATERTCPYETNTEKWRELKKRLYENLKNELITPTSNFTLIILERISLHFTTCTCKCFKDFMLKLNLDYEGIIYKCQEVAMKTSSTVDVTNNS